MAVFNPWHRKLRVPGSNRIPGCVIAPTRAKGTASSWAPWETSPRKDGRNCPGTTDETRAVAAIFPQAVSASEGEFTHDRAIAALREFDIVHFATHGVLDERTPLFSALLTSSAAGQPTRLSLFELPEIHIAARMIVLSACETGLGRMGGGDEISSLGRTFLMAGAATVVSSLWKVSDESTSLLMQEFYRGLAARLSPARAMRAAMIDVRKKYPHPFYWAPFQVTGAAE